MALRRGPGPTYLLKESVGHVDARGTFVNVSDGGHMENLGLYELLRRRCTFIIAVDAGADPDLRFSDLVTLMLYARIDRLGRNARRVLRLRLEALGDVRERGPLQPGAVVQPHARQTKAEPEIVEDR